MKKSHIFILFIVVLIIVGGLFFIRGLFTKIGSLGFCEGGITCPDGTIAYINSDTCKPAPCPDIPQA